MNRKIKNSLHILFNLIFFLGGWLVVMYGLFFMPITNAQTQIETDQIENNAVTNPKLADMNGWTIKLRNSAVSGNPEDQTLADIAEEVAPVVGDFLLGWESAGALRKFDVGDLPYTAAHPVIVDGAIAYGDGTSVQDDSTKFFYDDINVRLGIGTNSPNHVAHFHSTTTQSGFQATNSTSGTTATDGFLMGQVGASAVLINQEGGNFTITNNGIDAITIDSAGNVGITDTTPGDPLSVSGDATIVGTVTAESGSARIDLKDTNTAGSNINAQYVFRDSASAKQGFFGYQNADDLALQNSYSTGAVVIRTAGLNDRLTVESGGAVTLEPLATAPTGVLGSMYTDTSGALCWHDGTSWNKISGSGTCV